MTERRQGAPGALLVIISGPSGVGKDTIIHALRERSPDAPRTFVVTYKSRARRPGEVDGIDYHFVTASEFQRLRRSGAFLETANVHGDWSGTPRDQVVAALSSGRDAILKIDVQGARAVRERVPEALLLYVAPPSPEALNERLVGRGTETGAKLKRRQDDAPVELASQDEYDHIFVNETGKVDATAERIDEVLRREHERRADAVVTV